MFYVTYEVLHENLWRKTFTLQINKLHGLSKVLHKLNCLYKVI